MRAVSRFEADLLRLLHALLGRAPIASVHSFIATRRERPACLSRDAVSLIQDALTKGCVARLARDGGWFHARHLRGGRVVAGRLWERTPPDELGLAFSAQTLEFLLWLACDEPGAGRARWGGDRAALASGDRILLWLAYESLRPTPFAQALRSVPSFEAHGLCRLAFPDDFADAPTDTAPDFRPWCDSVGACVLEALQSWLTARWVAIEEQKRRSDPVRLRALARAQELVLDALLPALDGAQRHDLARFLLDTTRGAFLERDDACTLVPPEALSGLCLAERTEVQRSAVFLLSALERLREWERRARGVGYFDEGYAAAQLWKADWEAGAGEALCERGRALRRERDPLQR